MAVIQMSDRELTRLRVLIDVVDGRLTIGKRKLMAAYRTGSA
jgi:hypothetical protein